MVSPSSATAPNGPVAGSPSHSPASDATATTVGPAMAMTTFTPAGEANTPLVQRRSGVTRRNQLGPQPMPEIATRDWLDES
jgi:hypothetical protein